MKRQRRFVLAALFAAVLAVPLGAGYSAARPPRRVALLIGIAGYRYFTPGGPPGQSTLSGPLHDVERMRVSLRRFGFDGAADVRVLTDSQASREGMAAGFRWVAERANDTADVVVIFYSGHGSFTRDSDGDEARVTPGDTLDEALVPWDVRDIHDPAQLVIDDQIGTWLRAIRGTNVTVIIDGCFSGTATRGAEVSALIRPKGALGNASGGGAAQTRVSDNPAHTLISASSATETAAELPLGDNNIVFGALTYYLTRALDAAPPTARYDEVLQQVTSEIRGARVLQTPQLEGDRGALLFHVREAVARRPFVVVAATGRGRASIDVGAVHGVRRSAIYDVYPPGEMAFQVARLLGQLEVDSVESLRAWGTLTGVDSVPPGARATLARVPRGAVSRDRILVYVDANNSVRDLVASLPFVSLSDSSSADALVQAQGGVVRVLAGGNPVVPLTTYPPDWVRRTGVGREAVVGYAPTSAALCAPLARALAVSAFRAIENPEPPAGLRVQVGLVEHGRPPAGSPSGVDTAYIGRGYDLYVKVSATEASTLFLAAAAEGFSGEPTALYPTQEGMNQPVPLRVWVKVLDDVPMEEPTGLEVVKLYVGSDQFDFNTLLASLYRCGSAGLRGDLSRRRAPQPVVGWTALEHRILVLPREAAP